MSIFKRIPVNRFYITITVVSFLVYSSVLISPNIFWLASIVAFIIPGVLALNALLLLLALLISRKWALLPALVLISGYPFVTTTYQFKGDEAEKANDISILSLNTKFFRKKNVYNEFSIEAIQWAVNDSSTIKCFQEYSTNNRWEPLDVTGQISARGYDHFFFQSRMVDSTHNPGMAIFSKYPIINSGYVWKEDNSVNSGIFADIKIKDDTIRVYNVHMASNQLLARSISGRSLLHNIKQLVKVIKTSTLKRTAQNNKLLQHFKKCQYPIIVCGDFNEVPYSYNYFLLKRHISNTFEKVGSGFGFTYNGPLLFLRIDHQFFDKNIIPVNYYVDKRMKISDHFPTIGIYRIKQDTDHRDSSR